MTYKLTEFSHGAGCGCKIAPKVLDEILKGNHFQASFPNLLVGNDLRDDAAVFDLGDGTAIVSTTDFFMPIVDDPVYFGRIAAVNAISDVYAMGGTPLMAIAILGWPVDKLPADVANQVIEGGRKACQDAGIPLAGGHSIDSPEPIFGLAVTGSVSKQSLKRNGGAKPGDYLFLTKPLGVGILSTAQKKKKLQSAHASIARDSMVQLNKIGQVFGDLPYVHAMTDVTGFGLLGHLSEMCEASDVSATIELGSVPFLDKMVLDHYLSEGCIPGGTRRNWSSYGHKIADLSAEAKYLLCDPQTSGGLLTAVDPAHVGDFLETAKAEGFDLQTIGTITGREEKSVYVKES
ncbi:MAG: selenide, water dikinase SelD [Phaeodactylibacter sp.]|nr:selenide, water dikinase SelD [Phaeodactylibacter sp.]